MTAKTIKETLSIISEHSVDLVFMNNDAYVQDVADELFTYLEKNMLSIPLFVIGNTKVGREEIEKFESHGQLRNVIQSIAKSKSITAKMMAEADHPLYYPLPMEFMIAGWQTLVEIFIKNPDGYKVVFGTEEIIFAEQLDEHLAGNNSQLYVLREKRLKFVNSITLQITAKLNNPNLSSEDRLSFTGVAFQMVMEQARQVGVAESTMELAKKCIDSMNEIVKTIPTLDKLLKDLMDNTGSYRYKQSLLINYIGSHIIKKTKYPSKAQQEIFSFVSFFHNIALSKDKYAQIHSDQELKESDLSQEEKELITKHAILAAKLVSDSANKIPYEAAIILKQHHGSSRGLGLSNLTASISPLAIIFLFAQEWTNIVLMYQNDEKRPNKKEIIKMLQKKYPLQGFHNIISTLDTLEL